MGLVTTDVTELKGLSNVLFAGPQPYETLAGWAKAFDVAIIPTLRNRQRMNANPLKLREYLATGKPVITVSTPAIEAFANEVSLANTAEDFLTAIERELESDSPQKQANRRASVSGSTWENRVNEINAVVLRALEAEGERQHSFSKRQPGSRSGRTV